MSYRSLLEAGGAVVIDFEHFGSYQGDWLALVEYDGRRGFVNGSFGSCSHCDSYEAEFGDLHDHCDEHSSNHSECYDCAAALLLFKTRTQESGRDYLSNMRTYEEAIAAASSNLSWDSEAQVMVDWIKGHFDKVIT